VKKIKKVKIKIFNINKNGNRIMGEGDRRE
jgi:hypothetical protein